MLGSPESLLVWKNQPPTAFTTQVAEFRLNVTALTGLLAEQQATTTGFAAAWEAARIIRDLGTSAPGSPRGAHPARTLVRPRRPRLGKIGVARPCLAG